MSDNFYINREFDDFDEFAAKARLWNVEMTQLNCGKSISILKQLSLERVKLNCILFNGHKTTVGEPPPGRTFAFYSGVKSDLIWRKKKALPDNIMIFPSGAEHDVMTKGDNIHVHTITLPETFLSSFFSDRENDSFFRQMLSREIVSPTAYDMLKLKQLFLSYFKIIETNPNLVKQESFRKGIEEQIVFALVQALSSAKDSSSSQSTRKTTQKAWNKIDIILKKSGDSLLPVSELCLAVGVSERSLRRLFMERFGISPKRYLNTIRLNGVRRDLKRSSSSETKIIDIANNWGFWHMGQFAADYRKLFGELPSVTIQKESKRHLST